MRKVALGFALLSIAFAGGPVHGAARAAEGNGNGGLKWEYRVLTRDQISDLGKKDLAVGLNKLGNEGWELAAIDSSYIFKRPKVLNRISVEDAKNELTLIEADVDMLKERVAWSERMIKKGFMSGNQLQSERAALKRAEMTLERAKKELKGVPPPVPVEPAQKDARLEK